MTPLPNYRPNNFLSGAAHRMSKPWLMPQLFSQLKPGTRIVSHDFDMGEWKPERTEQVEVNGRIHTVYFWTVPANPPANLRS